MIIDAHCHAGTGGDSMTGPWDIRARLDDYLRRADRAGIERSVLIPVFHTDYRVANEEVGRIAARRADRFRWFCMVHPQRDRGRIAALVREARERFDARGIKIHRADAPISREVCEAARAEGIPVLYDPMGRPAIMGLVAAEYPDVPFILPHLGSFGDAWEAHVSVIDLLRLPNVHADTSGVRRFDYLVRAARVGGADKLIFGSDGPWLHPGLELAKIRLLGLSPADEAAITGGTIARLIGWPAGPSGPPGRLSPAHPRPSGRRLVGAAGRVP